MEFTKNEMDVVQQAAKGINEEAMRELNELQLALAGGGFGDVIFG